MRRLLMLVIVLMAVEGRAANCSAEQTLRQAGDAYRNAAAFTDIWTAEIHVPGAPVKREVVEFGKGGGASAYLRMPSLYVIEERGGRLFIAEDEPGLTAYVDAAAGRDLQASIDAAFGSQGPPLVPAPLLLSRAKTVEQRLNAFRMKLLEPLRAGACRRIAGGRREVELIATNGRLLATFDERGGWLRAISGELGPSIRIAITFSPSPGTRPSRLCREGRAVASVAALSSVTAATTLPDRALPSLDGSTVRLLDPDAAVTVIEFWATWCAPCRVTLPAMNRFARNMRGQSVRVLLVNTQEREDRARLRKFLADAGVEIPTLLDSDGSLHRALGGGLPLTIVADRNGRVAATFGGFRPDLERELRAKVEELLAASSR